MVKEGKKWQKWGIYENEKGKNGGDGVLGLK